MRDEFGQLPAIAERGEAQAHCVELHVALGSLRKQAGTEKEVATLTSVYHNLVRTWSET